MDKGIEFTDENGWLPLKRVGRVEPKVKYVPPTDEELEKIMKELPF
jgi:hypothetical protein